MHVVSNREKDIFDQIQKEKNAYYASEWTGSLPNKFHEVFKGLFYHLPPNILGPWAEALKIRNRDKLLVSDIITIANPLRTTPGDLVMKAANIDAAFYDNFMSDLTITIVEWNIAEDRFTNALDRKHAKMRQLANLPPL